MTSTLDTDLAFASIIADIEPLESLDAPWNWGEFNGGVAIGVGAGGVVVGGIAVGVALT